MVSCGAAQRGVEWSKPGNPPASTSSGRLPSRLCRNSVRWMALITVTSDSSTMPMSQPAHDIEKQISGALDHEESAEGRPVQAVRVRVRGEEGEATPTAGLPSWLAAFAAASSPAASPGRTWTVAPISAEAPDSHWRGSAALAQFAALVHARNLFYRRKAELKYKGPQQHERQVARRVESSEAVCLRSDYCPRNGRPARVQVQV